MNVSRTRMTVVEVDRGSANQCTCLCVCVCMYVNMQYCTHICDIVCICIKICNIMFMHVYIYMCVCVCVCVYIYIYFFFYWITMTRKFGKHLHVSNGTLNSCFDIIRSHQQCILWSPPLEIEPTTTEFRSRNTTTGLPVHITHKRCQIN